LPDLEKKLFLEEFKQETGYNLCFGWGEHIQKSDFKNQDYLIMQYSAD